MPIVGLNGHVVEAVFTHAAVIVIKKEYARNIKFHIKYMPPPPKPCSIVLAAIIVVKKEYAKNIKIIEKSLPHQMSPQPCSKKGLLNPLTCSCSGGLCPSH
jgi:hypothetical protein